MPGAADLSFPKAARLLRPSEFRRVQENGRALDLGPLVFRVAARVAPPGRAGEEPLPEDVRARLGLAVSRRVGGAVVRNRVKRLVREVFRHRQAVFSGLELVVSGRPEAARLAHADVVRLFDELVRRLGRS